MPRASSSSSPASRAERVQLDDRFVADVYDKIKEIPAGRVASYGQIAQLIGHPKHSRMVGQALKNLPARLHDEVPWHRVLASSGRISARGSIESVATQADLLELEGVTVENRAQHGDAHLGRDEGGRVSMAEYGWRADANEEDRARA